MTTIAAPEIRPGFEQPWFVLNSSRFCMTGSSNTTISHFYTLEMDPSAEPVFAVPDGCVDIIFDCDTDHPAARVCGTPLQARRVELLQQHRYFGVRFKPGLIPGFLHVLAEDLTEQEIDLCDVMPCARPMIEGIAAAGRFAEQRAHFDTWVTPHLTHETSPLTTRIIGEIIAQRGDVRIRQLEALSGYTGRTLQRQFRQDTGLTPKMFCRIVRCQSALDSITSQTDVSFSELALDLGFSDQSHFLRDFKKLVSATPCEYHSRIRRDAYAERILGASMH